MKFIPLHINSTYSYLSSGLTIEKLFKKTLESKGEYVSLTDFNSLTAAVSFVSTAKKLNLKPILGMDLNIEDVLLTFIIKNEDGYKNLLHIAKIYNSSVLKITDLKGYTNGLITVISSKESKLLEKYLNYGENKFAHYLKSFDDAIDDFYIGLEIYNQNDQLETKKLQEFLGKRNYNILAFPLVRYINKEDEIIYQLVSAIKNDSHLKENVTKMNGEYYYHNDNEIEALYSSLAIENTNKIASQIDFDLLKKRGKLLKYCENSDAVLTKLANEMLAKKIKVTKEYQERLDYELAVIKKMGYSDYFLIVMDYVKFAKDKGIYVGHGRGSAGGSLVAYALDIITIDPIQANLIFERFLNEGRKSMPDIDVDFEDTRRNEVVTYLRKKYSYNRVGNILAIQTIKAKQAVRDIGRIYNIGDSYINILSKAIGDNKDLRTAYRSSLVLKKLIDTDPYYLSIVKMASKIEGFPRQAGMHAAGVIIDDMPLENSLPVYVNSFDNYTSGLEKNDLEYLGFLKMDILGLINLRIVRDIIEEVNKNGKTLKYESLPYDDKDAIKLIATGDTLGLFQLESKGMIRTCKELKPNQFEDIVSLLALFRPGPMKFIPQFIARKEGREKITYPSNKIVDILKPTYGIIVYQEQIMQIVRKMANYTYSEADMFRRAISKKDASKLEALRESFIKQSVKNGSTYNESKNVFDLIYRFANYGFNRSHAYAYAKLAGQMAYLKVKYPATFYAAVLDSDDKFNDVVAELRRHNLKITLPDINKAITKYRPLDSEIVMPLTKIKGILNQAVAAIIKERDQHGIYKDFIDFVSRNIKNKITANTIIKLIDAGCFDSFKINRTSLRNATNDVLNYSRLNSQDDNQIKLDESLLPPPNIEILKDDDNYNVIKEYESLGINISKSPLDFYQNLIEKQHLQRVSEINKNAKNIEVIGMIKSIRRIKTKNNKMMCFLTLSDNVSDINVTIFNELYLKHEAALYSAKILIIKGRYDLLRDELIADNLEAL